MPDSAGRRTLDELQAAFTALINDGRSRYDQQSEINDLEAEYQQLRQRQTAERERLDLERQALAEAQRPQEPDDDPENLDAIRYPLMADRTPDLITYDEARARQRQAARQRAETSYQTASMSPPDFSWLTETGSTVSPSPPETVQDSGIWTLQPERNTWTRASTPQRTPQRRNRSTPTTTAGDTPMPVQVTAAERTYGVEIETCVPDRYHPLISPGHHSKGPPVDQIPDGWEARSDSSLHAPRGYFPVELVSPVLSGEDGLVSAVFVAQWLRRLGAQPNESTGMHVHVGASDLDERQIIAVRRAFIRYESALLALNGKDKATRLNNRFCQLSEEWQHTNMSNVDRYCSLNTTNWRDYRSYGGKPTIECRLWASTTDDTRVVAAICMFVALVQRAATFGARTEPKITDEREATKLFIRQHYGRGIRSTDLRVTPHASIADVMLRAYRESKLAAAISG